MARDLHERAHHAFPPPDDAQGMTRARRGRLTALQQVVLRKLAEVHPEWLRLPRALAASADRMAVAPEPLVAVRPVHAFIVGNAFRLTERGVRWCVAEGFGGDDFGR